MFKHDKYYKDRKVDQDKGELEEQRPREGVEQCELPFQVRMIRVDFIEKVDFGKYS